MKKILIALALGLLLVSLIATPAFARPARDALVPTIYAEGAENTTASGSASIAPTHTGNLKATLVLRGAMPDALYWFVVVDLTNGGSFGVFSVTTDSNGNARASGISTETYNKGDTVSFRVLLPRDGFNRLWWSDPIDVTFK